MNAWISQTYDTAWDATMSSLAWLRANDKNFTVNDAKAVLKHLYIQDGNDQCGRGAVQDAIMSATVDAYERFIAEWEASSSEFCV